MSIPTRAEARADRYYEQLAEDAAVAAETQAWTWHRKRHPECRSGQATRFGPSFVSICSANYAVKYALVQGVASMPVEQQRKYLERWGGESWG